MYSLALEDLAEAASLFRPEWERTAGVDGYVSLEVPPDVAYDAAATVALARRLYEEAGFPSLLVKIPGTPQGGNQSSRLAVPCLRDTLTPRGGGGVMPPCRKLVWPTASRAAQTRSSASPSLAMPW